MADSLTRHGQSRYYNIRPYWNKYFSTVNWMECHVFRQKRTYSTPCYHLCLATQLTCAFLHYESSGV